MSAPLERARYLLVAFLGLALVGCAPSATGGASASAGPRGAASTTKAADLSKVNLPDAKNGSPLLDGAVPLVSVVAGKVYRDGELVADVSAIAQSGRIQRVDGLWHSLRSARDQWKAANPGQPFPGIALFAFDKASPAAVVKSVFQTAAFSGYPNGQLAVHGKDGAVMRLDVDAIVPGPPSASETANAPEPGARLLLVVRSSKYELVWRAAGGGIASTSEVASIRELPERIRKEWAQHGRHREPGDKAFDQAVLYVGDDVDYSGIVAVIDAVRETTREYATSGTTERVPALNVNLGMQKEILGIQGDPLSSHGGLPPETIQRVVRQSVGQYRKCYERGLATNKSLAGSVHVRFVIQGDGTVSDVTDAGGSTLPDAGTVQCIMQEVGKLSFPRPEGGRVVTVVYPFVFHPDDSPPPAAPKGGGVGLGNVKP